MYHNLFNNMKCFQSDNQPYLPSKKECYKKVGPRRSGNKYGDFKKAAKSLWC